MEGRNKIVVCGKSRLLAAMMQEYLAAKSAKAFAVCQPVSKLSMAADQARAEGASLIVVDTTGYDSEELREFMEASSLPCNLMAIVGSKAQADEFKLNYPKGYVTHSGLPKTLIERIFTNIRDAASLERRKDIKYVEPLRRIPKGNALTPREHEIALKVAEGLSNRDIAYDLDLAEQTVKNLVSVIMRKMGCTNRVQVALKLSKRKDEQS